MNIVALDLSWTSTGLAFNSGVQVHTSVLKTPSTHPIMQRLDYLTNAIMPFVLEPRAGLVVIEGYSFGAKNRREQAGELGGAVKLMLWRAGLPFIIVQPTTLKKFQTGKGNAPKERAYAEWCKRADVMFSTNDEADAHGLWCIGSTLVNAGMPPLKLPQDHLDALKEPFQVHDVFGGNLSLQFGWSKSSPTRPQPLPNEDRRRRDAQP